jgi:hypothetical protein
MPQGLLRRPPAQQQRAVPPGLAGILVSPINPRPARPPALLAPWNLHHHALVSAYVDRIHAEISGAAR